MQYTGATFSSSENKDSENKDYFGKIGLDPLI